LTQPSCSWLPSGLSFNYYILMTLNTGKHCSEVNNASWKTVYQTSCNCNHLESHRFNLCFPILFHLLTLCIFISYFVMSFTLRSQTSQPLFLCRAIIHIWYCGCFWWSCQSTNIISGMIMMRVLFVTIWFDVHVHYYMFGLLI